MRLATTLILIAACGPKGGMPPAEPLPSSSPVPSARPVEKAEAPTNKAEAPAAKAEAEPAAAKSGGSDAKRFVDAHNKYRAKHCAPPLTWSTKLADVAQKWANTLEDRGCVFGHSPGGKYGENLAAGTQGALDPESTTTMWYDEVKKYKGGFSMETGHFSQVVWKSTKQVGCGHVVCKGNDIYVCNYDPPGNWEGQYKQQVLPTSCK